MKTFMFKILIFLFLLLVFLCFLILLPATPRASKSLLFAEKNKDNLLKNTESPRIILIGGSNLSFGINSQLLKDSLNLNPINTAIHAGIGLKYMLDKTLHYVKDGDIIIIAPEYSYFFNDLDKGSEELLRTVLDVNRSNIKFLNIKQISNCIPFVFKYAFSKLNIIEYIRHEESVIYGVNSFNQYGDVYTHWNLNNELFTEAGALNVNEYNSKIIVYIKNFEENIKKKGAVLYITYPAYQDESFDKSLEAINKIKEENERYGFNILGNPYRYRMANDLMFDTVYHLNINGVNYRTQLLIEDLKEFIF